VTDCSGRSPDIMDGMRWMDAGRVFQTRKGLD
jgi:hypothetical protein